MLRISEVSLSEQAATLRLEGEMIGPAVEETRRVIEQSLASGLRLTLDLADLLFVDRIGITLLRELSARQVTLINCSPFLTEQLNHAVIHSGEQR